MSRKNYVDDYAISLDIGNASVGWSAFTPNYRLVRAKGHELIGVRLFDPADTAEISPNGTYHTQKVLAQALAPPSS